MIKVLLTDDHKLVRTGIRRLLEDSQQVSIVGEADCGEKSIQLAKELQPDVILMDVNMPEMDGHEATKKIRGLEDEKKDIPIIALTASVLNTDIHKCLESGMNDYIPKPFKREELLVTLNKYYKKA